MDAFFASVEQLDNPSLRGKPVIVGSPPNQRGVVCAASYEARKHGVRSAMPSATAGRLCPKGVFVPVRMERYKEESAQIMRLMSETGARIEPMSIDEAYLEFPLDALPTVESKYQSIAEYQDALLKSSVPLARTLKNQIQSERGLTATIGIASNKLLAKLASDFQKPDGLTVIKETEKTAFLRPLSVRSLHGVGPVTEQNLETAGIRTVGDLQDYRGDLRPLVGSFAAQLKAFALGEDDRPLDLDDTIKSISSEETFLQDTDDRTVLRASLKTQTADIVRKLQRRHLAAQTVQVKVRYSDFTTLTRQMTVEEPTSDEREIYRLACWLLARHKLVPRPLRLLGIGVSNLGPPTARQLVFWPGK
jgi:DNA polymerase-4